MKAAGIIAEYNPFHNGHQYQIEETRRRTGADYVVVIMSGDFVQRGLPAFVNKYDRTRMALCAGADLVIQMPVVSSLSSAEGFAAGGVGILQALPVVTVLSFGCEAETEKEQQVLRQVAHMLAREPELYKKHLDSGLRQGWSYPVAREAAIFQYIEEGHSEITAALDHDALHALIASPNNILAIEYMKAMYRSGKEMELCMISRQGSAYHAEDLETEFASATGIRKSILDAYGMEDCNRNAGADQTIEAMDRWKAYCPDTTAELLEVAATDHRLLTADQFADLLYQALLQRANAPEASRTDLDWRMCRLLEQFETWTTFAEMMKTKNQTMTAIHRYLAGVLTGITAEEQTNIETNGFAPYIRILGYRKDAGKLVSAISGSATSPLLFKPVQGKEVLNPLGYQLFQRDMIASELYRRAEYVCSGIMRQSDYRTPLVLV